MDQMVPNGALHSSNAKFQSLVVQAKLKLETQLQQADLNRFMFNKVRSFDSLELVSSIFNPKLTVFRDYFEIVVNHPLASKTRNKTIVECFLLTSVMGNADVGGNIARNPYVELESLVICTLEDPGRAMMFPPFRQGDFVVDDEATRNYPQSSIALRSPRNKCSIILSCPDTQQMNEWTQMIQRLFPKVKALTAPKADAQSTTYHFGSKSEEILTPFIGLNITSPSTSVTSVIPAARLNGLGFSLNDESKASLTPHLQVETTPSLADVPELQAFMSPDPDQMDPKNEEKIRRLNEARELRKRIEQDWASDKRKHRLTASERKVSGTKESAKDHEPKTFDRSSETKDVLRLVETLNRPLPKPPNSKHTETNNSNNKMPTETEIDPNKNRFSLQEPRKSPHIPLPEFPKPSEPDSATAPVSELNVPKRRENASVIASKRNKNAVVSMYATPSLPLSSGIPRSRSDEDNTLSVILSADSKQSELNGQRRASSGRRFAKALSGGFRSISSKLKSSKPLTPKLEFQIIEPSTPVLIPEDEAGFDYPETEVTEPVVETTSHLKQEPQSRQLLTSKTPSFSKNSTRSRSDLRLSTVIEAEIEPSTEPPVETSKRQTDESSTLTSLESSRDPVQNEPQLSITNSESVSSVGTAVDQESFNTTVERRKSGIIANISSRSIPDLAITIPTNNITTLPAPSTEGSSVKSDNTAPEISASHLPKPSLASSITSSVPSTPTSTAATSTKSVSFYNNNGRVTILKTTAAVFVWQKSSWKRIDDRDIMLVVSFCGDGGLVTGFIPSAGEPKQILELNINAQTNIRRGTLVDVQVRHGLNSNIMTMFRTRTACEAEDLYLAIEASRRDVKNQPIMPSGQKSASGAPSMASSSSSLGSISSGLAGFRSEVSLIIPSPIGTPTTLVPPPLAGSSRKLGGSDLDLPSIASLASSRANSPSVAYSPNHSDIAKAPELLLLNNLRCKIYSLPETEWELLGLIRLSVFSIPDSSLRHIVINHIDNKPPFYEGRLAAKNFARVGKVGLSITTAMGSVYLIQLKGGKEAQYVYDLLTCA